MAITLSLLLIVLLLLVGVPFWVSLGLGTTVMLATTSALPLTLIGEALFEGVDSFALIAIPLFILTGDIMVRSKLAHDQYLSLSSDRLGLKQNSYPIQSQIQSSLNNFQNLNLQNYLDQSPIIDRHQYDLDE